MRQLVFAVAAAAVLVGCSQTVTMTSVFNAAEAEHINRRGQGSITGQLFMRQMGGNVVYGAGSNVYVYPRTAYTEERMKKIFKDGKMFPAVLDLSVENEDPNFQAYRRTTKADGQGRFNFVDLAPGNYYLTGVVSWCAPGPYGTCNRQGGALIEQITIAGAQKLDVIMDGS